MKISRKEIFRYIVDCAVGFIITYVCLAPVAIFVWQMNSTQFISWTRDSFIFNLFLGYMLSKAFDFFHKKLKWLK